MTGSYYSQLELRPKRNHDVEVPWTNVILASVETNLVKDEYKCALNLSQLTQSESLLIPNVNKVSCTILATGAGGFNRYFSEDLSKFCKGDSISLMTAHGNTRIC